jgi:flagellar M-ring protein FliF
MKEKALNFAQKAWNDFKAFTPGQKAATIAAIAALVVGGFLYSSWKGSPQYAPLYSNLAATDAQSIIDKLNSAGTPYKLSGDGTTISVPKSKVYSSRIALSAQGLPNGSQGGYDLLNQIGVTTSEFMQQVDYQRAVEGELAKTIEAINGITAASVHLAIPQQNVFNDGTQKPTASVLLTTAASAQLTSEQVQSIAYLVSSSIPDMDPTAVTITDQKGNVLNSPDGAFGPGGTSSQDTKTADYNTQRTAGIQSIVDKIVGAGHSQVAYNATLNWDQTSTETQQYLVPSGTASAPPVSVQTSSERYKGGAGGGGGVLGASPTPSTANGYLGGNGSYSKDQGTIDYGLGTEKNNTKVAPGTLKQQNVSIALDTNVPAATVATIQQLVSSYLGINAQRGDTLQVQALKFDNSQQQAQQAADAAAAKAAAAKAAKANQQALIKEGAIAGVALIALLVFFLRRRKKKKAALLHTDDYDTAGWWDDQYLAAAEAPAPVEAEEINAEISEAQARRRALITLAQEQPDDVARVLSSWLNS